MDEHTISIIPYFAHIQVSITFDKEWFMPGLQQSINGTLQLESKTHVTHLTYPNFYGIRQYGVLIIPLSG